MKSQISQGKHVAENDLELQLKVWKELAISKQVMMRGATDALKLDPNCTQEELKQALEAAVKRSIEADVDISKAQEQAKLAISVVEKQLADNKKALDLAEAARAEALANYEKLQQQMIDERNQAANELKKLKDSLAEKDRSLKAINTALSDTPENVVKKLKALKKEKMDESNARKQAEEVSSTLRKEKQKLEQTISEMQAAQDGAVQLATLTRELHTLCTSQHEQLEPLVADAKELTAVPLLDSALLEGIEKAGAPEEKKPGTKNKR
jgi:colicin import membrane protein